MGTIRDKIIQRRRDDRSGRTGPKTTGGNYKKIQTLQDKVAALEAHADELEARIGELEE